MSHFSLIADKIDQFSLNFMIFSFISLKQLSITCIFYALLLMSPLSPFDQYFRLMLGLQG